ncbi:coiled-coil domain-containing protein 130 homolog [Eupeodes corollae]|uniref:coiled-coil domain-containing protein 130 homolog n=1 Tax=Eupeodes corollae TaxID=290404 RepID=UPI0024916CAC|nr:coiled-coil domain-containing protein 130 homolog [Eupeodes corollae]
MGERKGQNKYYPPDYDPKRGGLNKFLGTHALRERARKLHVGILIIRFEMPYNIWCEGCNNHIGMGVRYNAEKKKVGMYYSTPVYQFRMKCHLCDNHFEIKTDPGNLDYVIISGARRQENRWDPLQNEQVVPETKEVQKRLFDDPMYKLEHLAKDIKSGEDAKPVLEKLFERNENVWDDCYEANSKLRAEFRKQKKEIKIQKELDDKLLQRSSLEIGLLPESEQDRQMAALMKLQSKPAKEREEEKRLDILTRPALPSSTQTTFGGLKRQKLINSKLSLKDLGIKKKKEDDAQQKPTEAEKKTTCELRETDEDSKDLKTDQTTNNGCEIKKSSLGLVCDYSSSSSD